MDDNLEPLRAFKANSWFAKPLETSIHIKTSELFPRYLTLYEALSYSGPDIISQSLRFYFILIILLQIEMHSGVLLLSLIAIMRGFPMQNRLLHI